MRQTILVDTGPIVAYLRAREHYHDGALEQFNKLPAPLLPCEAVLMEAAYLVQRSGSHPERVLDLVTTGALTLGFDMEAEAEALKHLLRQYHDVPMSLADACLVRMAEIYPHSTVLTLDSDFHIYRRRRREIIAVISPGMIPS